MADNTFNDIRQAILDKILAEETTVQEAYFEQRPSFEGSPAVVIGVSNNEALYNSNMTDKMTFVFELNIYIPIKTDTDPHEVETRMGLVYWEILQMFRKRDCLNGVGVDIVEPLPSSWSFEERDAGIFRVSVINLRCVVFKSNR